MQKTIFARPIEGFATNILRNQLHGQIAVAEKHLKRFEEKHGTSGEGYIKRQKALEAVRNLYAGYCGKEEPRFSRFAREAVNG